MVLSLYSLLEASLLVVNAIVILHEERFLNKIGWGRGELLTSTPSSMSSPYGGYGQSTPDMMSPKYKFLNMIHSIRTVARVPLIPINILVIVIKLIFG